MSDPVKAPVLLIFFGVLPDFVNQLREEADKR